MSTSNTVGAKPKARVFISYSRKDSAFAQMLRDALEQRGFAAYLDTKDIFPGEDWRARLEGLILAADAVVFVISPESVARWDLPPPDESVCAWEIRRTVELKKQLTPVVWRALAGATIPPELGKPNWVSFVAYEGSAMTDEAVFTAALDKLETALGVAEILWVREHTKWVARAADWDKVEPARPEGKLLRATDIAAVEAWVRLKPATAPEIPPVLSDYLAASVAKEQRDREELSHRIQRLVGAEARRAFEAHRYGTAMRLALAGEPSEDELKLGVTPEPNRRARLAAAGHASQSVACLSGHSGGVRVAAFSGDGTRVVTASRDRTARLWDPASGAEIACFRHDEEVWGAAFSADGARIVTASWDKTARVTASLDGTARVWEATSSTELARLPHDAQVGVAIFTPHGDGVVTASRNIARVWDASSSTELACLVHGDIVASASLSLDGRRVVTASRDGVARVWDAASGDELAHVKHDGPVNSAVFSPDGMRILSASRDGAARLSVAESGNELTRFRHDGGVWSAVFSSDGARVLTASADRTARVWDAADGTELARLVHDNQVGSAIFSSDGARVVTASWDKTARLWDASSGTELARLIHGDTVTSASFSIDRRRVVTASRDGTARVWDAASGAELASVGHGGPVNSAVFNADALRVLTASDDWTASVWDAVSGDNLARLAHTDGVLSAAFSPDAARVVTASRDNMARVWDVTWAAQLTGERLARAVARQRLKGSGRLSEEERRTLRPILGEVDADVTSRWLTPSSDDAKIVAILGQWHGRRETALALAKKDWAARAEQIRADLAVRRAAAAGPSSPDAQPDPSPPVRTSRRHRWLLLALCAATALLALVAARSAGFWP